MVFGYSELQATSNFSFLEGASHPEELVQQATLLGYRSIAISDRNSLAGIVRAYKASQDFNIKFIVACRLELKHHFSSKHLKEVNNKRAVNLIVFPRNKDSYGYLARLLSIGKTRAPKGDCYLDTEDFFSCSRDLVTILLAPKRYDNLELFEFEKVCRLFKERLGENNLLSLALTINYQHQQHLYLETITNISKKYKLPLTATNDVLYHCPSRRALQDVLTCIKNKTTIAKAGYYLQANSERYLKPVTEIFRLFKHFPSALRQVEVIHEAVSNFCLSQIKYNYPSEVCPNSKTPFEYLSELTWQGANQRYPNGVPDKIKTLIAKELELVHELNYEKYFLTCYDIVQFANSKGILCQGRGAAANSAICYCLGITAVNPDKINLLFERFVSKERNEPPDIDIDFEHERREEVIQYIYEKYGRERAGLTAEVITYRHKSAVRDVAKVLGLPLETINQLSKQLHHWTKYKVPASELAKIGIDPESTLLKNLALLSKQLLGFPRHLSQHVGGFVISDSPLCEIVPILNARMEARTNIEWDKDDIETLGMLKIDVLGLGMLSCIRKALEYANDIRKKKSQFKLELYNIPPEDTKVYDMICDSDTIGVFQIESRAQMSMLPRLKPRCFYDLVIEVAIVRPGPIQGKMVHPYLKRRNGLEQFRYPDERVKEILGKTLGVPLFQEQAMRLAIMLANFTPGEAEKLRRSMAAWKRNKAMIASFKERIIRGMLDNGYSQEFAESCFNQIKGFSEYGFPESHAASFANLVYVSAWLKHHYPAQFACALLNSQPMGFYAPRQIINSAKAQGVKVSPIDINYSHWDSSLEEIQDQKIVLRLGMRLIRGIAKAQVSIISEALSEHGPFRNIKELWLFTKEKNQRLRKATLYALAKSDSFNSMGIDRTKAIFEIQSLPGNPLPLDRFSQYSSEISRKDLPPTTKQLEIFKDHEMIGLSLKGHPMELIREGLNKAMVASAKELQIKKVPQHSNYKVTTAGKVIFRQRPGTASGVVFLTLEDETGISNLVFMPNVFERFKAIVMQSKYLLAYGKLEKVGKVVYVNVISLKALRPNLFSNIKSFNCLGGGQLAI